MTGGWLGWVAGAVALLLAFFGVKKAAVKQGVAEGKLEEKSNSDAAINRQNEATEAANAAVLTQVEQAHEIHDRLESDPAYADSVRARFTRPD